METEEMLEQTNETENTDTQSAEEVVEGIELTDTSDNSEQEESEKEEVKMFTQEEVDKIVKGRLARKEREYQRELSKYRDTENVLKTTIGGENIDEVNSNLRNLYEKEGVELPNKYEYGLSNRDMERLAIGDAEDIIEEGYDSMVEEANRLANIGYENMNSREKIIFNKLAESLTEEKNKRELKSLGATEELLNDENFIKFKKMFNSNTPIKDIYSLYKNNQPKKQLENPGSMRTTKTEKVKDFYTDEEISKLTLEDLDKPGVYEAVRNSMTKNYNS